MSSGPGKAAAGFLCGLCQVLNRLSPGKKQEEMMAANPRQASELDARGGVEAFEGV